MGSGDVYEVMRTARAVRRFRPEPLDTAVLRRCLEAATWAPSGGNQQPWRFVILQGASVYPAMQNFLLAARAEGLGAVVTGWAATGEAELRAAVAVPDDFVIAALVAVGWPIGGHGPVRRRPVEDVVAVDRWDEPLA